MPPTFEGYSRGGHAYIARHASPPPAIEMTPQKDAVLQVPCDATATGVEAAQVQLIKGKYELNLCSHHFTAHELALAADGWRVTHDIRGSNA